MTRPLRPLLLLWLWLGLALAAVPAATAQPEPQVPGWGFAWERVGDYPPQPALAIGLGFDGHVWVTGQDGVAELHEHPDRSTFWRRYRSYDVLNPFVLGDTLWYTDRSSFGNGQVFLHPRGTLWSQFPETYTNSPGGGFLVVGPLTSTAPGRFFTSSQGSIGYSDHRGRRDTWIDAGVVPNPENTTTTFADDIALFPAPAYGGAYPGRVLLAGQWGVAISDDRGASWRISDLWQYLVQAPRIVTTLARPGGGTRVVTFGKRNGETCRCTRVWTSEDGGETWTETAQLTGNGLTTISAVVPLPGAGQAYDVPSYETPSALAMLVNGLLWRTDDGGATWANVGQVPIDDWERDRLQGALHAPDGRFYVTTLRLGPDSAWVWRTSEPLPVAAASVLRVPTEVGVTVRPNPSGGTSSVEVTLPREATVEAVVYDALGRRVAIVHKGTLPAGRRVFEVDVSGWPPGVYVVRVHANESRAEARLTVLR